MFVNAIRNGAGINRLIELDSYCHNRLGSICPAWLNSGPRVGGVLRVDIQPVKTTLYSLSEAPPAPAAEPDRREGDRLTTLYRVGSILISGRRELCLIKNISAGGMMVRLYGSIAQDMIVTVELKSGQPISGRINWTRDHHAGVAFDQPIDVIDILSSPTDGPRQRMPRIETNCHATLRDGANSLRVRACDISQGGVKIKCETPLAHGANVIVTLPGLAPHPGIACWTGGNFAGITFNRLIPLRELIEWLKVQRDGEPAPIKSTESSGKRLFPGPLV